MLKRLRLWWWRQCLSSDTAAFLGLRGAACYEIGRIGDVRDVESLIKCLEDVKWRKDAWDGRYAACKALAQLGDDRAVEVLSKCRDDKDRGVRRAVGKALGQLHDTRRVRNMRRVGLLIKRLGDDNSDVRRIAIDRLQAIYRRAHKNVAGYLCPEHLTRFERRKVQVRSETIHYYACRICREAGDEWQGVNEVVCVLDSTETVQPDPQFERASGRVCAWWDVTGGLFDFDVIEIRHATDNDVERLCINVGNNEDPPYKDCCTQVKRIVGYCALSDYIWTMLRDHFPNAEFLRKDHERQDPEHDAPTQQIQPNPQPAGRRQTE